MVLHDSYDPFLWILVWFFLGLGKKLDISWSDSRNTARLSCFCPSSTNLVFSASLHLLLARLKLHEKAQACDGCSISMWQIVTADLRSTLCWTYWTYWTSISVEICRNDIPSCSDLCRLARCEIATEKFLSLDTSRTKPRPQLKQWNADVCRECVYTRQKLPLYWAKYPCPAPVPSCAGHFL